MSLSVSPFVRLEVVAEMLMTSALRRDSGELERCPGPRARFDKEIDQRFSAQRRDLLDLARADLLERIRRIENEIDFVRRKLANPEQIFSIPAHARIDDRHASP